MEQFDANFTDSTDENVYNMFAFFEGVPINDKQVSLTCVECESTIRKNIWTITIVVFLNNK
jgi:hypothetical protein